MRLLLTLCLFLIVPCGLAESPAGPARDPLAMAERAYEAGDFSGAAALLEEHLAAEPGCARCAHLLGKSYGRLAERAGGLRAFGLARKTRVALERAVELAPQDPAAVADLIRYYRAAPGFLGGSVTRAEELERRLADQAADGSS